LLVQKHQDQAAEALTAAAAIEPVCATFAQLSEYRVLRPSGNKFSSFRFR
jgi:hypothetical protein